MTSSTDFDRYFELTARNDGILWLKRRPVAIESAAEAAQVFVALEQRLLEYPPTRKLLVDVRRAPFPKGDREIERVITEASARIFEGFAASAILIETAAGSMQAHRLSRAGEREFLITQNEKEAVEYLERNGSQR